MQALHFTPGGITPWLLKSQLSLHEPSGSVALAGGQQLIDSGLRLCNQKDLTWIDWSQIANSLLDATPRGRRGEAKELRKDCGFVAVRVNKNETHAVKV
jgi:hypothetical protein